MQRLIKFERGHLDDLNAKKYVLVKEYEGFGLYEEVCPAGWHVHQSWAIANDKNVVICESYNNCCKDEMLDMIDNYNQSGKFNIKAFTRRNLENRKVFVVHPRGCSQV